MPFCLPKFSHRAQDLGRSQNSQKFRLSTEDLGSKLHTTTLNSKPESPTSQTKAVLARAMLLHLLTHVHCALKKKKKICRPLVVIIDMYT